ncbi:MAG: ABC transporter ATP-binding protein/permease [Oscillospiraceae bacterium]|nr:ABC transporter ATP-binding protein/permease [Oscillospiraceae bacterium]
MKRRSGIRIMGGLLRLLTPLLHVMLGCITLGTLGYLCAIFITVLAAHLLLTVAGMSPWALSFGQTAALMLLLALARAGLRYGEQTCGHYIAFKLLAVIRDKVFGALRRLAPAKLEGKGRGDLIAVVTGDIELLEVFYAHTIAPVCIALIVSLVMTLMIAAFHPLLGVLAAASYLIVGVAVPLASSSAGRAYGMAARAQLGGLNNVFLESLRGIREVLQFGIGQTKEDEIRTKTAQLNAVQGGIKRHEGAAASWSGALVMLLPLCMLGAAIALRAPFPAVVLSTVMLSASFGPVLALANLSAAMDATLAAGERVLSLLEEAPETPDVVNGETPDFTGAAVEHLSFAYDREEILHDLSAAFPKGEIVAVTGKSGSGKSTLLKLLMRFWRADENTVKLSDIDVGKIDTAHLRCLESYMTQDTDLFNVSVRDNIRIGRLDATDAEVEAAAKKASIHDFILTLPHGYDTKVGELGDTLSGGERQRIGLARAFLHDAPLLLLDEPTSNLDSLNEGVILKALREEAAHTGRTVVLVSHRKSTLAVAERAYAIESGRLS